MQNTFDKTTTTKNYTCINIPNGVEEIGRYAFRNCGLTSVTIPGGVKRIYSRAFWNCSKLTSIEIPNSVEMTCNVFEGCRKLTSFNIQPDNPLYSTSVDKKILLSKDGKTLIAYPSATGKVVIPDSITRIGDFAFSSCTGLTSITIPDSVMEIESFAFSDCKNLTSITLPNRAIKIGLCAFSVCKKLKTVTIPKNALFTDDLQFLECSNLTAFVVDSENQVYSSSDDGAVLLSKDKKTLIAYPSATGKVVIPSSVNKISPDAFVDCDEITSVTFSDPKSWFYTDNKNFTNGRSIDVSNPIKNVMMVHRFYLYKN